MLNANGEVYPTQPWMLCKAMDPPPHGSPQIAGHLTGPDAKGDGQYEGVSFSPHSPLSPPALSLDAQVGANGPVAVQPPAVRPPLGSLYPVYDPEWMVGR